MRESETCVVSVLGVDVLDVTLQEAIARLIHCMESRDGQSRSVFFVNTHTLNLACSDAEFRRTLNQASWVFGDGTGVRWATRMLHGRKLKDNVNGTDLVPRLFQQAAGCGYRYYLLGGTEEVIERAGEKAKELFPGWVQAGRHHGYLTEKSEPEVVRAINETGAELLLVGMGNPIQERFIERNLGRLRVPLCLGIGGLFTYWSGDLTRAPVWVRRIGYEWLHLLISQPHKFSRYMIGNPLFLSRVARSRIGRAVSARGAERDYG